MHESNHPSIYKGIFFASLAALIWAGNFIIARGVYKLIPPISLNFYRWLLATIIIFPFAFRQFKNEWHSVKSSWHYLFWTALMGISLFNTFVYIGGHYSTAINLALIGTTSSPIIAIILARIFLKEKIGWKKLTGLLICIAGILFLLSKGDLRNIFSLHFSQGDGWILLAAFCFAVYNILVRKKPRSISPVNFLFTTFLLGTILMIPFFIWESNQEANIVWNREVIISILYLAIGASIICFFLWNIAIRSLGAGSTALFSNLIPIFSSIAAVIILHEKFTVIHLVSMLMVFSGLMLANFRLSR